MLELYPVFKSPFEVIYFFVRQEIYAQWIHN